jgi:hypothetical protein
MMSMARLRTMLTTALLAACSASCSSSSPTPLEPDAGPSVSPDAPSGAVGCSNQPGLDTYSAGTKKLAVGGRFEFELVSSTPAPPALGNNTFLVRVTAPGGDTALNGDLIVALDMPEHGHPSPKAPNISFDPDLKTFTLDPMDLFMVGLWRITFTFFEASLGDGGAAGSSAMDAVQDSAVFKFCIE